MHELETARILQEQLYPAGTLRGPSWEVVGNCRPATWVGGDYFDYFPLPDGRVEQMKAGGKPLGTKNKSFQVQEYRLDRGDWLLLYTDGFVEAAVAPAAMSGGSLPAAQETAAVECVGYERIEAILPNFRGLDAAGIYQGLQRWWSDVAAEGPQADDITLVVLGPASISEAAPGES